MCSVLGELMQPSFNSLNLIGSAAYMWNSDVNLQKEDVGNVLVWVIFHGVPMTLFIEDSLSIIVNKLGTPLMLGSYTSDMCMHSWGWSSYARAMIEPRADEELKDTIMVATPKLVGDGFNMCTIHVQYDWKPHRYDDMKPLPKVVSMANVDSDSEVEEVFDEHATFLASTSLKRGSDSGYGTNSLWEQWKEMKRDDDYDLYDDDLKRISHKRTKNKVKNDKTEHGMEKCEKAKPN
ncbi:putative reverse transcriptase domain-containing protein [Tanacetum coccineum]